jgi:rubrerythrin
MIPKDLKSAFETGVQADIDNIAMYDSFLARSLPEDVREVFKRLRAASKKHLRALQNQLTKYR